MTLELRPVTLREARRFIGEHHRHNLPPRGWRFVSAWQHVPFIVPVMVGVGVAGRPTRCSTAPSVERAKPSATGG